MQFIAATQPINSLAFVLDGVNFGASDFAYTAYSMVSTQHMTHHLTLHTPCFLLLFVNYDISGRSGGHKHCSSNLHGKDPWFYRNMDSSYNLYGSPCYHWNCQVFLIGPVLYSPL